ncbi:hypothetical protein [Nannocystis radixulma]|uniref:ELWxxDGT repeat-containing protein n=1 Tax=Nannocystis radixulma TaxID=2995305 RepID=A0ABT5B9T5_9BACT|nr:hypothetical protein [Nannocystis radixulma]MDC0670890.1 hypothetical protein [Nannocystis radixulma]
MRVVAALLALAFAACLAEDAEPVATCPFDQPVRLAGPPPGWTRESGDRLQFQRVGEQLFYRTSAYDDPKPEYSLIDRCGGEPEHHAPDLPGARLRGVIRTADHFVLYAEDAAGRPFVLDRLDVPGLDEPRPVLGLPAGKLTTSGGQGAIYYLTERQPQNTLVNAAGIGAPAYSMYAHHGDPAAAAVLLGEQVVRFAADDDRLLLLHDDGTLRDVDLHTGESELVLTGVRHFATVPASRRLIWQQLGDDLVEPVFLRDRDTGEDIQIAVNDFTAASWNRLDDPATASIGHWLTTPDGTYAALYGPELRVAAVVRTDTGAAVVPPADTRLGGLVRDDFNLALTDDDELVLARWNPRTGVLREWYRAASMDFQPGVFAVRDDSIDYLLFDGPFSDGTLWRVDLETGETTIRVPRVGFSTVRLADGRYFTGITTGIKTFDLVVFDPDTSLYTTIAADVGYFELDLEFGMFYVDERGPKPGLWAAPIPPR